MYAKEYPSLVCFQPNTFIFFYPLLQFICAQSSTIRKHSISNILRCGFLMPHQRPCRVGKVRKHMLAQFLAYERLPRLVDVLSAYLHKPIPAVQLHHTLKLLRGVPHQHVCNGVKANIPALGYNLFQIIILKLLRLLVLRRSSPSSNHFMLRWFKVRIIL